MELNNHKSSWITPHLDNVNFLLRPARAGIGKMSSGQGYFAETNDYLREICYALHQSLVLHINNCKAGCRNAVLGACSQLRSSVWAHWHCRMQLEVLGSRKVNIPTFSNFPTPPDECNYPILNDGNGRMLEVNLILNKLSARSCSVRIIQHGDRT